MVFFIFNLFEVHWAFGICKYVIFIKSETILIIIFSNMLPPSLIFFYGSVVLQAMETV